MNTKKGSKPRVDYRICIKPCIPHVSDRLGFEFAETFTQFDYNDRAELEVKTDEKTFNEAVSFLEKLPQIENVSIIE